LTPALHRELYSQSDWYKIPVRSQERKEPWIAFKILAVGVIPPAEAFTYAFNNGADFICVGMFEWQIVDNVNLARQAIKGAANRPRPWRAASAES